MNNRLTFADQDSSEAINHLKKEWLSTLTRPQDGMWATFRDYATQWKIMMNDEVIGYASVDDQNQLLQFYISPPHLAFGEMICSAFIQQEKISNALVGTNNPIFLSIALGLAVQIEAHTLLFELVVDVETAKKDGTIHACQSQDINRLVEFCHLSMGAPKNWLEGYLTRLIDDQEINSLEIGESIIGTYEVRRNSTAPMYADIGMIVSPAYRKQGYGVFLLNQAKTTALEKGMIPICSCEIGNIGSQKAIHKCGFASRYRLIKVTLPDSTR